MLRIEWQPVLHALQGIYEKRAGGVEDEERDCVELPAHFRARIDSAEPVDQSLEAVADANRPDRAAFHDVDHVKAERLDAQESDGEIEGEEAQRLAGHQNFSGLSIA
jgi:hypothetical protein